jgi:hypothetical protein
MKKTYTSPRLTMHGAERDLRDIFGEVFGKMKELGAKTELQPPPPQSTQNSSGAALTR